jgi:4-hydroxymandelate synthase
MWMGALSPLSDLEMGYVEIYVSNLTLASKAFVEQYSFTLTGTRGGSGDDFHSIALGQGEITLVLTEGGSGRHPATAYTLAHGDGVADISLRVADPQAALDAAVSRGAHPVHSPAGPAITAFGDVVHTFVRSDGAELPAGFRPVRPTSADGGGPRLLRLDHFAVCVESGTLDRSVEFYRQVLGFELTFTEKVRVGNQAMNSQVVQSPNRRITLTIIEPDSSAQPGQIDEFLKCHHGPGVQHLAFGTDDAVRAVDTLAGRGVRFLTAPGAYYEALAERVHLKAHTPQELRNLNILVDEDHGGQLFQIFTASTHERRTLFFEIIERLGARSFGTSNITALYEAVQQQRVPEHGQRA